MCFGILMGSIITRCLIYIKQIFLGFRKVKKTNTQFIHWVSQYLSNVFHVPGRILKCLSFRNK